LAIVTRNGSGVRALTITLKLKSDTFDVTTRDSTGGPVSTAEQLESRAGALLARELDLAVRSTAGGRCDCG
jgi:hypothetical protein